MKLTLEEALGSGIPSFRERQGLEDEDKSRAALGHRGERTQAKGWEKVRYL